MIERVAYSPVTLPDLLGDLKSGSSRVTGGLHRRVINHWTRTIPVRRPRAIFNYS